MPGLNGRAAVSFTEPQCRIKNAARRQRPTRPRTPSLSGVFASIEPSPGKQTSLGPLMQSEWQAGNFLTTPLLSRHQVTAA
jgi:hypothetical protein